MKALGHGIFQSDEDPRDCAEFANHIRFLNVLWLPKPLNQLTAEQILVINRFRERALQTDDQFAIAQEARNAMKKVVHRLMPRSMCEVGCGMFPLLVPDVPYIGVDIDRFALGFLGDAKIAAVHPDDFQKIASPDFDFVLSLYAMHFNMTDDFLSSLAQNMTREAVFCFNLIADVATTPLLLLASISRWWPVCSVIKCQKMARKEYFIVAGGDFGIAKISTARAEIMSAYNSSGSMAA